MPCWAMRNASRNCGNFSAKRLAGIDSASERSGSVIEQLSKAHPEMTIEDAYDVQRRWTAARSKAGARVVGRKIGLTSRAMRRASKMTEPDYGVILDVMLSRDGACIADNAAFAAIVPGGKIVRPFDINVRWVGATLAQNGVIEETGLSAGVMGHPAAGIAWLVNKFATQGDGLHKGDMVSLAPLASALREIFVDAGWIGNDHKHLAHMI